MYRYTVTPCLGAQSLATCARSRDTDTLNPGSSVIGEAMLDALEAAQELGHDPTTAGFLMVVQVAAIDEVTDAENEAGWTSDASAIDEISKPE